MDGLVGRDARCLSRPMASAARDLAARFRGESLAGTAFTWRSELEAARELAGLGRLAVALAEEGDPWSRMDGRLLFALAEEALGGPGEESGVAADPESAALLFQGARVALAGEGPGDRAGRQRYEGRALATLARIHLLELARAAGRWEQAERLATELLRDWRRGNLHRLAFEGRLGVYDPARGVDPARRLGDIAAEARARVDGGRPVAPSPDGRER